VDDRFLNDHNQDAMFNTIISGNKNVTVLLLDSVEESMRDCCQILRFQGEECGQNGYLFEAKIDRVFLRQNEPH